MKSLLFGFAIVASAVTALSNEILRDDFDFYPSGTLTNNANWPGAIPGTTRTWRTAPQGEMSIVSGTDTGRSGQLFHYQVSHAPSSPDNRSFSSMTLNPILSEPGRWTLSLDFYVAALPADGGRLGLITLFNSATATAAYRIGSITFDPQQDGTVRALMGMGSRYENPTTRTHEIGFLDTGKWYTLTIEGNNENRLLSGSITGNGFSGSTEQGYYGSAMADRLQQIAIGSFGEGPSGNTLQPGGTKSVYIDRVVLQIPEPGSAALTMGSLGLLAASRMFWSGSKKNIR